MVSADVLVIPLASFIGGLLVGALFYGLSIRASRRLAAETGQFDRPVLKALYGPLRLAGDRPLEVLYVWRDRPSAVHLAALVPGIKNSGAAPADAVTIEVVYPMHAGHTDDAVSLEIHGFRPGLTIERKEVGGRMRVFTSIPHLAPQESFFCQDSFYLSPTWNCELNVDLETADGVQDVVRVSYSFSLSISFHLDSREGKWPGGSINIGALEGTPEQAMTEWTGQVERCERERFRIDEGSRMKWVRRFRYFIHRLRSDREQLVLTEPAFEQIAEGLYAEVPGRSTRWLVQRVRGQWTRAVLPCWDTDPT